jgi:phenylpropionate dioxygenase-like ring-hydroxylating dioxygenase large terminal subunit
MLTAEENEVLCRVGPGTPMGTVLRRYWTPAFQLGDLPEPDCPPIRVTILGENFVAFRDTNGRLGFLDELCCHRGASLALGRVEYCGIRCLYHGWKYAVDGTILETPNLATPTFRERVKHGAYPVREAGGLGWVYLGPPGTQPPFPSFAWSSAPPDELAVSEMIMDCNWMQVLEGSIDSSHVAILHLDTLATMGAGPRRVGSFDFAGEPWDLDMQVPRGDGGRGDGGRGGGERGGGWPSDDNAPRIEVENTPFGFHYAAIRDVSSDRAGEAGKKFVRVTAFVMPYTAFIGGSNGAVIVVPRDDYTCSSIGVFRLPPGGANAAQRARRGVDPAVWGPEPGNRRLRLPPQDREAMAAGKSFAGFRGGNRIQDGAVQMSSGKMYDRAKEHLVPADLAIIRLRRLLADSIRLTEAGHDPPGLGEGCDFTRIAAASQIIDAGDAWQDLV